MSTHLFFNLEKDMMVVTGTRLEEYGGLRMSSDLKKHVCRQNFSTDDERLKSS